MRHVITFFSILGLFLSPIILIGCVKGPINTTKTDNTEFRVDELFTHGDCTVYRFEDNGYHHYFTNCHGSVLSTESCGKNCTHPDETPTNFSAHY